MNKFRLKLIIALSVAVVLCVSAVLAYSIFRSEPPDGPGAETPEWVEDEGQPQEPGETVESSYTPEPEILIDYTDLNKFLYDYAVEDFNLSELNFIVENALWSTSVQLNVGEELLSPYFDKIVATANDGALHLVIRCTDDEHPVVEIKACSYEDRINPIYMITLEYIDETWSIS